MFTISLYMWTIAWGNNSRSWLRWTRLGASGILQFLKVEHVPVVWMCQYSGTRSLPCRRLDKFWTRVSRWCDGTALCVTQSASRLSLIQSFQTCSLSASALDWEICKFLAFLRRFPPITFAQHGRSRPMFLETNMGLLDHIIHLQHLFFGDQPPRYGLLRRIIPSPSRDETDFLLFRHIRWCHQKSINISGLQTTCKAVFGNSNGHINSGTDHPVRLDFVLHVLKRSVFSTWRSHAPQSIHTSSSFSRVRSLIPQMALSRQTIFWASTFTSWALLTIDNVSENDLRSCCGPLTVNSPGCLDHPLSDLLLRGRPFRLTLRHFWK